MKKALKVISLMLVAVLMVMSFAACGSKDDTVTGSDTSKETKTPAVKVIDVNLTDEEYAFGVDKNQPELLEKVNSFIAEIKANGTFDAICNKYFAGGTPDVIKSAALDSTKDQLVVATNAAFEPFEYTNGDGYSGIDMEIAKALADYLGKELVIQNMDFDSVCLSVGQHKCDVAMAGLTVKAEREEYVTFSTPYYKASQRLVVKGSDTKFDGCTDVASVEAILNTLDSSVKIGVQNGTTGQLYCEGDAEMEFPGLKAVCVGYKSGSLAVQDMINGNINYVIIDAAPAACIAQSINEVN